MRLGSCISTISVRPLLHPMRLPAIRVVAVGNADYDQDRSRTSTTGVPFLLGRVLLDLHLVQIWRPTTPGSSIQGSRGIGMAIYDVPRFQSGKSPSLIFLLTQL